jgi:hypothetical protein
MVWLAFCCVGALAIANALDLIDRDQLGWWLAERQVKDGGLNGRPEKLADVRPFLGARKHSFLLLGVLLVVGSILSDSHRSVVVDRWKCSAFLDSYLSRRGRRRYC